MSLSVVYPPSGSTVAPAVDIVAVHGLGGDAVNTWTHPQSGAFWLKDFLPEQIRDARILTFSYNATAAFSQSTAKVVDHAKSLLSSLVDKRDEDEEKARPIVFIAHSLGGIVVKQALLQARLEPRYKVICDATIGILFFGTPHRGSDKAAYGVVLSTIAQKLSHRPPSRLISALRTNGDVLLRLTSDFKYQLPQYQVVTFFETRPMKLFSSLIVEKHSALLEVEQEDQIPVDANHSAICKFEKKEDDTYDKAWRRIQRMRKNVRQDMQLDLMMNNIHYEVPHLLSSVFTGRDEICQRLASALALSPEPRQSQQRRFVLHGFGGSGKTQICLKYAQTHRRSYWGIFWIDASTNDSIQQSMVQIACLLQIDQNIDSVKRALTNSSKSWLLIFDNADDPSISLTPYFPTGDRGDIVITTRNPGLSQYNTVGVEAIGDMSPDDSVSLLLKTIYGHTSTNEAVRQESHAIVKELGFLALAVTQAGAYIREMSCSLQDYLELYQRYRKKLWAFSPRHTGTDYRYTVYTTWQVSLDAITRLPGDAAQNAIKLLKLLCFYHHEKIPLIMFFEAWRRWPDDVQGPPDWLPWSPTVKEHLELCQDVQACVALLAAYSLIARGFDSSISMHPLVHEWCRHQLPKEEYLRSCQHAISLLAISVEMKCAQKNYAFRRQLVSHVLSCLSGFEQVNRELSEVDENATYNWSALALILAENGLTNDAIMILEQVIQLGKSRLREADSTTLTSMDNLAICYGDAGRREEALTLTEQVVQLRKSQLGETHPDTLASMHNLAQQYSHTGRREEALTLIEQVMQLQKSQLGETHPNTLRSIHSLALQYSYAGRREEALILIEQVVQLQRGQLGETHPDTLASMHNLAQEYSYAGRREEALTLIEQVVQLRKSQLGETHPDTLLSIQSLAIQYGYAGRREEAVELIEQVVQLLKSHLGETHPHTLRSIETQAYITAKNKNETDRETDSDMNSSDGNSKNPFRGIWRRLR